MRTIQRDIVGAFLFSSDNCLLLGKSRAGGAYHGLWIVPGGGIEPGETHEQAICREVLEEVGLDIRALPLKRLALVHSGQTEKTLKDTDERVLVAMTFYDFAAHFDEPAAHITPHPGDDIVEAQWFPLADLDKIALSAPTIRSLHENGYL